MILVNACLAGINSTFKGKSKSNKKIIELVKAGKAIPVCPEQLGGLTTPRSGARIMTGRGEDVLDGKSRVISDDGSDMTEQYLNGANETLRIARRFNANAIVVLQGSPSCGNGRTQGGEKSRKKVRGDGVTVALLKRNGIEVIAEKNFDNRTLQKFLK